MRAVRLIINLEFGAEVKKKKEKFLLENEIVFNKSYILNYNSKRASYRILNDLVLEEMGSNIDEIFRECFKSLNKTEAFYKMLEVGFVKQAFLELLGYGNYKDFEINLHGKRCITCNDALTILFVLLEEPNDAVSREICESFYLIDHFKTKLILIDRSFKVGDIEHTTLSSHKISERCIQNEVPENNLFLQYIQINLTW
mgnify:CR=1 FL=1